MVLCVQFLVAFLCHELITMLMQFLAYPEDRAASKRFVENWSLVVRFFDFRSGEAPKVLQEIPSPLSCQNLLPSSSPENILSSSLASSPLSCLFLQEQKHSPVHCGIQYRMRGVKPLLRCEQIRISACLQIIVRSYPKLWTVKRGFLYIDTVST